MSTRMVEAFGVLRWYLTASWRFLVASVTLLGSSSRLPDRDEHRLEFGVLEVVGLMCGQRIVRGLPRSFSMSARMRSRCEEMCDVLSSKGSQEVVGFTSLCFSRCFRKRR